MQEVAAPQGIKEVKEVIEALMEISLRIGIVLKDGYQPSDLKILFDLFAQDQTMKKKIMDASDGITKIGGEIKDLDSKESIELVINLLNFIPKFIELFKK